MSFFFWHTLYIYIYIYIIKCYVTYWSTYTVFCLYVLLVGDQTIDASWEITESEARSGEIPIQVRQNATTQATSDIGNCVILLLYSYWSNVAFSKVILSHVT